MSTRDDRLRGGQRVGRTTLAAVELREDVTNWFLARANDHRFARFASHLRILSDVLDEMFGALERGRQPLSAGAGADAPDLGALYRRCAELDANLLTVQRLFDWYATKYDQRLDDRRAATLRAADEIVRSCWTQPFALLRHPAPPGPLAYLDARFDAFATPRVSVPTDLRAPADSMVAQFVAELPIPTIALPDRARREPWWLVLAAHETGHHIQKELTDGLEAATRACLRSAVDPEVADDFSRWSPEIFADAYSVLMVGAEAAWAIDELQFGPPRQLVGDPDTPGRYPPPIVRLALLGEFAKNCGVRTNETMLCADGASEWLDTLPTGSIAPVARESVHARLRVLPFVASGILALPVDGVRTLHEVAGLDARSFAAGGRVDVWARQLERPGPGLTPVEPRSAARAAIAAGVRAYSRLEEHSDPKYLDSVRRALLDVLPHCGGQGVLAAERPVDGHDVGRRLARVLLDQRSDTEGGR